VIFIKQLGGNMRKYNFFLITSIIIFLVGCVAPYPARITNNASERKSKVLIFDRSLRNDIAVAGFKKMKLVNGSLTTNLRLKNQTDKPLTVQVKIKFKDKQNFFIEESKWKLVVIPPYKINTVNYSSRSTEAVDFAADIRNCQ